MKRECVVVAVNNKQQTMNDVKQFNKIQELVYELKVSEIMKSPVITVQPETLMSELRTVLRSKRISGTPVVKGGELVGIISIEDFINWQAECEEDCPIGDKMSREVKTVYGDEPLIHAIGMLDQYGFGRLPVINREEGKLVGIVTKGVIMEGLLRSLEIDYHEEEIHHYRASHIFEDIIADRTQLIFEYRVKGNDLTKGGEVASGIKKTLKRLGIHPDICRRAAIASYEAEMNLIFYANGGNIKVLARPNQIHISVKDTGPGIPDIQKALQPGFSTASEWIREMGFGAGMGLNNIQQCADDMDITSAVGKGTSIEIEISMEKV
jgi:CBS domain-containing protein/anti-sigma regulatory factor (Ser/Thr protein kinase)